MNGIAKQRWKLWVQNPNCHWCGKKTQWIERVGHDAMKIVPNQDDEATIDHLHSRFSPLRGTGKNKNVLACWRCNNERCRIETLEQGEKLYQNGRGMPLSRRDTQEIIDTYAKLDKWKKVSRIRGNQNCLLDELEKRFL